MSYANDLEKAIKKKLIAIKNKTLPVKGCGVNDLIAKLKTVDEAGAEILQKEYIDAFKSVTEKKD
jgi:hypothetical protein